jgi:hypothetical protein
MENGKKGRPRELSTDRLTSLISKKLNRKRDIMLHLFESIQQRPTANTADRTTVLITSGGRITIEIIAGTAIAIEPNGTPTQQGRENTSSTAGRAERQPKTTSGTTLQEPNRTLSGNRWRGPIRG